MMLTVGNMPPSVVLEMLEPAGMGRLDGEGA